MCKNDINKKILLDITKKLPENEISGISFAEGPLNDVIFFIDEIYGGREEKTDASRLSDGTLSCLAIIAAVLSEEEEGMVVIEEIDNGLHPGRAKMLIQQISGIARRKVDVLFTTHNPVLLNTLSKDDLYGVNIVYRENNNGNGKIITLVNIKDMPMLLAGGNHIAHNGDGNQRRQAAERFCKVIRKTLEWEAPWAYYGKQLQEEDLKRICVSFPDAAMRGEGFGDLSIINAYNKYKNETPAISEIRIWSIDSHLQDKYNEKFELPYIRNN